jgi:dehydrogenase/reductase SDR family protein 12
MGGRMSYAATATWWFEGGRHYTKQGFLDHAKDFSAPSASSSSLKGRHVAITGANAGLGFALALQLAAQDAVVHLVCRNRERGERAVAEILRAHPGADARLHVLDVSSAADVRRFVEEEEEAAAAGAAGAAGAGAGERRGGLAQLQVLVNNAGVVPETLRRTAEGNEVSMATAMGGSFLLTSLLLPTLKKNRPSRVVNMSSGGMYTCKLDPSNLNCEKDGPENYDGVFAYAHAKRAQVILTEMWQEKLRGSGVTFHSTHPGWCDTPGVQGKSMDWFNSRMEGRLRTPAQGIDTAAWLAGAADPRLDDSAAGGGDFWFDRVPVRKHMPLAWTRESPADRLSLWKRLCEMWSHEPEV